jgi:hypothetical protein
LPLIFAFVPTQVSTAYAIELIARLNENPKKEMQRKTPHLLNLGGVFVLNKFGIWLTSFELGLGFFP